MLVYKEGMDLTVSIADISSKFEIAENIGSGEYATVSKCVSKENREQFALKTVRLESSSKRSALNEIEMHAKCNHEFHTAKLYEAYQSRDNIYLIMELCKGQTLTKFMEENGVQSEEIIRIVMKNLLEVLEFIHSKRIVHRDIKPENIMIDDDLSIKIIDFGFAYQLHRHDKGATDFLGSPEFLSPECASLYLRKNTEGYGCPTDMWAAGVIMYQLLTGVVPFPFKEIVLHELATMITNGIYSLDNLVSRNVSDDAIDMISKLLVVDPNYKLTASKALQHHFLVKKDGSADGQRQGTPIIPVDTLA